MRADGQNRWVGYPLDRVDGPDKVTGKAAYSAEIAKPGLLFAHVVQSTIAKGRITGADTTGAKAVPGVAAVWTPLDAPRLSQKKTVPYPMPPLEILSPPYYVLQDPEVAFYGQDIGLVVAESSEAAAHAASLVKFTYREEPSHLDFSPETPTFTPEKLMIDLAVDYRRGGFETEFNAAEVQVDEIFDTPAEHHNSIESGTTTAFAEDGVLVVHTSTQDIASARLCIANSLSLSLEQVRVVSKYVGGGFGSKNGTWPQTVLAAYAAWTLQRPVRLPLTRPQMFFLHGHRAAHRQRIRLGATNAGRLMALGHDIVVHTDVKRRWVEHTGEATPMIYVVDNVAITHRGVASNIPAPTIMRAPGAAPGMFALESAIDELADTLGFDPIELRLRNDPAQDPETGLPWSSKSLAKALREGAQRFGWDKRNSKPGSVRRGRAFIGYGVAVATYPANRLPCSARVRLGANGQATVETAATDIGTGTYTILTQIAADELGLPPEAITVTIGDSALPPTPGSGGSWGALSFGTAVKEACQALKKNLQLSDTDRGEALLVQLRSRQLNEAIGEANSTPSKEKKASSHAFGAHFVEVSVDRDTFEIRVPRMLGVFGVGKLLNPKTAHSQLMGGMVWGLGMALLEASILDRRTGAFINHDLGEYHIPVNADIRQLEVVVLDEEETSASPLGGKGLGEIGIVGVAGAIANAVYNATGIRVRKLPINLESIANWVPQ